MGLKIVLIATALLTGVAACTTVSQSDLTGMSFSDRPLTGKVIWNDLITKDLAAARQFNGGLFGWTFENAQARSDNESIVARHGDSYVAGIMPRPGEEIDPVWLTYFGFSDPRTAAARAQELGGTVLLASNALIAGCSGNVGVGLNVGVPIGNHGHMSVGSYRWL